jgi:urate oxidase
MDTLLTGAVESSLSSTVELKDFNYGKSGIRLVKVERHGGIHHFKDLTMSIRLSGKFSSAYRHGDNSLVLPTDTMKNTVYALAGKGPLGEIEEFGLRLAHHFLSRNPHLDRVLVNISERIWERIQYGDSAQPHSFRLAGPEHREVELQHNRDTACIESSIRNLVMIKTANSSFENFLRDEFTTLKGTHDRLLRTSVCARWRYAPGIWDYGDLWLGVRNTLVEIFSMHESRSLQHTLGLMGEAVIEQFSCIAELHLAMPNLHCQPVDLTPFHLENRNEVFVATEEPHGVIEAVFTRRAAQSC